MTHITKLIAALFLVGFCIIKTANSVKCYSCSTNNNESCFHPYKYNLPLKKCDLKALQTTQSLAREIHRSYGKIFEVDAMAGEQELNCLKQVTKDGNKQVIIRGCQLATNDKLDICQRVRDEDDRNTITTLHCSRCNIDACNSANRMALKIAVGLIAAVFGAHLFANH